MKDSNWNYNDGEFYLGFGGTAIVYLEQNPCGCCPNSVFREVRYLGYTRVVSSTIYFENMSKDFKKFVRSNGLIHLKPKDKFTKKELEFWENYNKKLTRKKNFGKKI